MRYARVSSLLFLLAGVLITSPALADKPSWAGGRDDGDRYERSVERGEHGRGEQERERRREREHFSEQNRDDIRNYYAKRMRSGRCPPGLAKKHNGCMPPGQAKKWKMGQPLPRDVIFYNLPRRLSAEIGPPPAGHRYVRVANDILLIATGTGMVVDAIEDLGRQ